MMHLACSFDLVPSPALRFVKGVLNHWKLQKGISNLILFFLVDQLYCYNVLFSVVWVRAVICNKTTYICKDEYKWKFG